MTNNIKIAVLGGGHAGFAHAADLTLKGFEVRLCEVPELAETIAEIKIRGGIESVPDP
jgi:glycerol-3-phosphate dehydrogenase